MTCSVCGVGTGCGEVDICPACASKVKRVPKAGRGTVNFAARRTLRLVAVKCGEPTEIETWYAEGASAGKNW